MNTLDITFSFVHLKLDYNNNDKWDNKEIDLKELKTLLAKCKMNDNGGVNALFWSNHDQPRIINRLGNYQEYHYQSATAFASVMMLLKGVPFIYQAEEIGHLNAGFEDINQYRDVESINFYHDSLLPKFDKLELLKHKSRDNGRTPIYFNQNTITNPWISYSKLKYSDKVKEQIFKFYQHLIKLKKNQFNYPRRII